MIEIKGVTKIFGKNFRAVDDLSLNIEEGSIYGFLGPNGAGKTTTLKMITGILKADAGSILINNIDIDNVNITRLFTLLSFIKFVLLHFYQGFLSPIVSCFTSYLTKSLYLLISFQRSF